MLAVAGDLDERRVVEVTVTGIDLQRPLHAVWRAGHQLTGPAAAMLAIAMLAIAMLAIAMLAIAMLAIAMLAIAMLAIAMRQS